MVAPDYRVSEESRPVLLPYEALPRNAPQRTELFSFLADAVADPQAVTFEQDDDGLRWTWLDSVALVWRVDLVRTEIDVIYAWDERE